MNSIPKTYNIQDMFQDSREQWLLECRKTARELLKTNDSITIEDVTKIMPRPTFLHRNLAGRVFNDEFEAIGFSKALHKEAKGRWIRTWRMK